METEVVATTQFVGVYDAEQDTGFWACHCRYLCLYAF